MKIITLTNENFRDSVAQGVEVLMRGGIVLFPTDTLYGLAVDATNPAALARLRELKGREKKKPISILVPSVEAIGNYVTWNENAKELAQHFLPGPLTLILPTHSTAFPGIEFLGQVGIRVPQEPFDLALAEALGRPYTATSANRSGLPTLTTAHEILVQFGPLVSEIDLVIDAGPRSGGKPSTVVTFKEGLPYIVRKGVLSKEDLGINY